MTLEIQSVAPAQLFSFTTQVEFFAYQLIKYEQYNCNISVEKIGDLGVEGEQNTIVELKNAQSSTNNPLRNSSVDLWKTLFNWTIFFYNNNSIKLNDFHCILYVYSKNPCNQDISRDLELCNDSKAFRNVKMRIIKEVLKKENYKPKKMDNVNQTKKDCIYYIEKLLSRELCSVFEQVIYKFSIIHSGISYIDLLRKALVIKYGVSNSRIEEIMIYYLGWVHKKVSKAIDNKIPVVIHTNQLGDIYKDIADKFLNNGKKFSLHESIKPTEEQIQEELINMPLYLKQLKMIGIEEYNSVINSYLKYTLERLCWIRDGFIDNIDDKNLIDYQEKQKINWSNKKQSVMIKYQENNNEDLGKLIYFDCIDGTKETLKNEVLDPVLQRGIWYEMSNYNLSNRLSIGWHPKYKELLIEENKYEK